MVRAMTGEIVFKDITEKAILRLKGFEFKFEDGFKPIVFQLDAAFDFFQATTTLNAEEFDFLNMKEWLEKLYSREWKTFIFNPIEEKINIQFDLQDNDKIKVHVKLFNEMYTGRLEFEYLMDRIAVPDVIREIDLAMVQKTQE